MPLLLNQISPERNRSKYLRERRTELPAACLDVPLEPDDPPACARAASYMENSSLRPCAQRGLMLTLGVRAMLPRDRRTLSR